MACKTTEEMKTLLGSRRQLTESEAEHVTGGQCPDDWKYLDMTWVEAGSILQAIVNQYGVDVAADWAAKNWSPTIYWAKYLHESKGSNEGFYAAMKIWDQMYDDTH